MRFAGQLIKGTIHDRKQAVVRALRVGLAALLAVAAADVCAESGMLAGRGGQSAASARIGITIVIPAVLILDRRTGTFYSNDAKAVVALGTLRSSRYMTGGDRDVYAPTVPLTVAVVNGGRVGPRQFQGRGPAGIAGSRHPFHDGEVICIP
jgi:hypothetical protein